ncbi:MAG: hypothetical protein A2Z37_13920 [Chloroflexi bacterium RBG_19FT_COMBO_62_14]|nr:MAG: hypothetical protein A2Z37_13920 [Chloroflexi bacterium RBG_19FT_COMBO_62_14]
MTMQALNQLVARSIIDPAIVQSFSTGRIGELISDLDFSAELRERLSGLKASSWAEYAVLAYRVVKATERATVRVELPSPAEGLLPEQRKSGEERVA